MKHLYNIRLIKDIDGLRYEFKSEEITSIRKNYNTKNGRRLDVSSIDKIMGKYIHSNTYYIHNLINFKCPLELEFWVSTTDESKISYYKNELLKQYKMLVNEVIKSHIVETNLTSKDLTVEDGIMGCGAEWFTIK